MCGTDNLLARLAHDVAEYQRQLQVHGSTAPHVSAAVPSACARFACAATDVQ